MSAPVTHEIIDDIAIVRFDDGKANAVGYEAITGLTQAIDDAEAGAKALVLIGREGKFSAGFDLGVMAEGTDQARELVSAGGRLSMRMYGARVPIIAACTGHALAFGAIMLMASDVRVGADVPAKIGLTEVSIGMSLPVFAVELARDRLSRRHFTRATALATAYPPAVAVDTGYLDEVVPLKDLEATALERARQYADTLSPSGFAKTRVTARQATIDHILSTLDDDMRNFIVPS